MFPTSQTYLAVRLVLVFVLLAGGFAPGAIQPVSAAADPDVTRSQENFFSPNLVQTGSFPTTQVLDDFNREDGNLGENWGGTTAGYSVTGSQLSISSGGNIYWAGSTFGVDQEAFVTLTHLDPAAGEINLILKGQSNSSTSPGQISVSYSPSGQYIQVWTAHETQGWRQHGQTLPVAFADGDHFGVIARSSGQVEVYRNGLMLESWNIAGWSYHAQGGYIGMSNFSSGSTTLDDFGGGTIIGSPTVTPTFTAMPTPVGAAFPSTSLLEDFNRADGPLGSNWLGLTDGYAIASNQLDVISGGNIYWQQTLFGVDQEAFVTFTHLDPTAGEINLVLKGQSNTSTSPGQISVLYSPSSQHIQVWTNSNPGQGWQQQGQSFSAVFIDGDQFGVRAKADGQLEVYRNGAFVHSWNITGWPYYAQAGYIGLSVFGGDGSTILDNFGGGTMPGSPALTPTPYTCTDPTTCDVVEAIPALWRCNGPECVSGDWLGGVIAWPSWSAYQNNSRTGDNARSVYSRTGNQPLYPYMGSWADGCEVTAVSGTTLIIEWQRGTDLWRSTFLEPGQSHTIDLVAPEDGALIEAPDGATNFSVSLENCTPQDIYAATPTPGSTLTASPSNTAVSTSTPTFTSTATFTSTPTLTSTPTFTAAATNTRTFTPTSTATNTPSKTSTFTSTATFTNTPINTPTKTATSTFTPTKTSTATLTSTFTPTRTPTNTFTPTLTSTSTATRTYTPTNTAVSPANLKVQLRLSGSDDAQRSDFYYRLVNTGTTSRSNISVRIYFTLDGSQPASKYVFERWWDQSNAATISGPVQASGSTYYFTVNYGSASLAAGSSWEFQTTLHLTDWTFNHSGANDWWHKTGTLPSTYTDWSTIPAYVNGALVWGSVPGGTAVPTSTPTRTPTQAATATPINRVTSFTLVNADTDADIRTLTNGETINLATLPTLNLNIRANTSPATVGSVRFDYDGTTSYRVENTVPYALASDDGSGNYNPWTPTVGQHTLSATTFSGSNATGTSSGTLTISFTVVNTPPTATRTPTATATPPRSSSPLYLSLTDSQTIGGVSAADEDILRFDGQNWSMFFDGSDVGVSAVDLSAFSIIDSNSLLMAFNAAVTLNGFTVNPQDVVRFEATSLGNATAGTFSMYLDGSDVGLTTIDESIDTVDLLSSGLVAISTTGDVSVTGVTAGDEDVLAFDPSSLGNFTSGTWSIGFDGSDVGLADTADEDVDAMDVTAGWVLYLSTVGDFAVPGVSGTDDDIFVCTLTSMGTTTACTYSPTLYFDGSTWGLSANDIDAFNMNPTSSP